MKHLNRWFQGLLGLGALVAFLLLILAGTSSCAHTQEPQNLAFEIIETSSYATEQTCVEKEPDLFIIATPEEADALDLNEQLGHLDYQRHFAAVVCRGVLPVTNPSLNPEVRQVTRYENKVVLHVHLKDFKTVIQTEGAAQGGSSPYQLIAVSKEERWQQEINFVLEVDGKEAKERSHFIP